MCSCWSGTKDLIRPSSTVTAQHVILPAEVDDNKEYMHVNTSKAHEDMLILGTSMFKEKLATIDRNIQSQCHAIDDAKNLIRLGQGRTQELLQEAEEKLQELRALCHKIGNHWGAEENHVIGELIWTPPITLSTKPNQYTPDLATTLGVRGHLPRG